MSAFDPGVRLVKRSLDALGLELRRVRPASGAGIRSYSNFGEDAIIGALLGKLPIRHRYAVDIGAGDGEAMSNSYALFREGWAGLAAEWDGAKFSKLAYRYAGFPGARLARARVTDTTNTAAMSVRNSSASHKRGREIVAAMSHTGELKKTRIVSNSSGSARVNIDPAAARFDVVM